MTVLVLCVVIPACTWWVLRVYGKITEHQNDLALQRSQAALAFQAELVKQAAVETRAIRALTAELQAVGHAIDQNHQINLALIEQVNARLYDQDCTMWDLAVRTANTTTRRVIKMP